ncbi:hypothetical protein F4803DRAFT_573453 [Xylaria telfairii]|nr:hypothetical protein F4803DRAFT_573453 [Xylaria telfairii]
MRYEKTNVKEDLEAAIFKVNEAIDATPDNDPDLAGRLSNLAKMLLNKYRRTNNTDYLKDAILSARKAVDKAPDVADRVSSLVDLSTALSWWYEQTGDGKTLDQAISFTDEALRLAPEHKPDGDSDSRNNLDLKKSAPAMQTRIPLPSEQSERAGRLSNLGSLLYMRYKLRGDKSDLDKAISNMDGASNCIKPDHSDFRSLLNNLAVIRFGRYERDHDMADLNEAISKAREVVKATPNSHLDRPGRLGNLSNMLLKLYEKTEDLDNLNEAITIARSAISATPYRHPDLASRLDHLSGMLLKRYEVADDIKDRDEAGTLALEQESLGDNRYVNS